MRKITSGKPRLGLRILNWALLFRRMKFSFQREYSMTSALWDVHTSFEDAL